MQIRKINDGEACSASGSGLEEAVKETEASRQAFNSWGVELGESVNISITEQTMTHI
jgi:hypothetical protein